MKSLRDFLAKGLGWIFYTECEECDGTGELSGSFGGDGYGDRCAGIMDWEADCTACNGTGMVPRKGAA